MKGLFEFFDYFSGLESAPQYILGSGKPVYIYGMGNGGEKVLGWCADYGIDVSGVFASDDFVRGQSFCGYKVKTLSEVESECGDFIILLAFGTALPEIMSRIEDFEKRHILLAPEVPVIAGKHFDKSDFMDRFDEAARVYDMLADDISRETFVKLTAYKITGRLGYLREIFTSPEKSGGLLDLGDSEIYCDLGAYNGDTVVEFVKSVNGRYRSIYALEPEKRNFQKCVKNCISLDNIEFHNAAAWSVDGEMSFENGSGRQAKVSGSGRGKICARSLDSVLAGRECTYVKYDVEGADIPALKGSENTVKRYSPKLCCALYHRCYDYIEIPLYINKMNSGYRFYMRQYPYYPAWETNLFAVK